MNGMIINKRYVIDKRVGKGSFGEVYIGYDQAEKHLVAIKVESGQHKHVLRHENNIYRDLVACSKPPRIPTVHWYGSMSFGGESKHVMVMKYLGNSLEYLLHNICGGRFSVKTTLMLGVQMLDLMTRLHGSSYIHRDIKPDNFLVGIGPEKSQIFLIDFGLAKRFKSVDRVHIKKYEGKKLIGTARYASINSHKGVELSRRDDLESLGYLLIYFINGRLPWQNIPADTKEEKYQKIGEMKESIPLPRLCEGTPTEIFNFMAHVRSLEFKEKPNYTYLRSLLINAFNRIGYTYDNFFDWEEGRNQAQTYPFQTVDG